MTRKMDGMGGVRTTITEDEIERLERERKEARLAKQAHCALFGGHVPTKWDELHPYRVECEICGEFISRETIIERSWTMGIDYKSWADVVAAWRKERGWEA